MSVASQQKHEMAVGFFAPGFEGEEVAERGDPVRIAPRLGVVIREGVEGLEHGRPQAFALGSQPVIEGGGVFELLAREEFPVIAREGRLEISRVGAGCEGLEF